MWFGLNVTHLCPQPQLGLVAATRSTACPNVCQVRRDPEYREGDELYYHATWKFGDEPAQPLHVDEIASRVDTVMRGIAASPAKFSSKALTISLHYSTRGHGLRPEAQRGCGGKTLHAHFI